MVLNYILVGCPWLFITLALRQSVYQLLRKFLKQHFVTVFRRNPEQPLFTKVVSEISEAVFFDRLWEKSGKTFIKSVSEISGAHFVTVFRRNLGQYRNCFGNFWSNILWPSINKFCMKPWIKSVLVVSETHLVTLSLFQISYNSNRVRLANTFTVVITWTSSLYFMKIISLQISFIII